MQMAFETAHDVCEAMLERSGRAIFARDFDAFADCVGLPCDIETYAGRSRLTTQEHLRNLFEAMLRHQNRMGVTDIIRHCVEAEFKDDRTVYATFETRLLRGTVLIQNPYPAFCIYKLSNEVWRAHSMTFGIGDSDDHNNALMSGGIRIS